MARRIRTLRHWKQQFQPNAAFVFRKTTVWDQNTTFLPGDPVPEGLLPAHRLRRYWEAGRIELAEFDEPLKVDSGFNHEEDDPERAAVLREVQVEAVGGNWFKVRYGDQTYKERGREALSARLDQLRDQIVTEQQAAAEAAAKGSGEGGAGGGEAGDGTPLSATDARQLTIGELREIAEPHGIRGRSKAEIVESLQAAGVVGPDYDPDHDPDPGQGDGAGAETDDEGGDEQ